MKRSLLALGIHLLIVSPTNAETELTTCTTKSKCIHGEGCQNAGETWQFLLNNTTSSPEVYVVKSDEAIEAFFSEDNFLVDWFDGESRFILSVDAGVEDAILIEIMADSSSVLDAQEKPNRDRRPTVLKTFILECEGKL